MMQIGSAVIKAFSLSPQQIAAITKSADRLTRWRRLEVATRQQRVAAKTLFSLTDDQLVLIDVANKAKGATTHSFLSSFSSQTISCLLCTPL
jgi:uncharacterized protein YbjT (DUF2867 family)